LCFFVSFPQKKEKEKKEKRKKRGEEKEEEEESRYLVLVYGEAQIVDFTCQKNFIF
jgi:hypothetical protein